MKAKCIWLTGLPCSGKTTIAKKLLKYFPNSQLLDGDEIRNTPLAKNVGFSLEDRADHIRRMGQIAKILVNNGVTTICSFVSPSLKIRNEVRAMFLDEDFYEVFVDASLDTCIARDVKGMYKKAIAGEIPDFTGISAPFDTPLNPDIVVKTEENDVDACTEQIIEKFKM